MEESSKPTLPESLPDAAIESDRVLLLELQKLIGNGLIVVENDSDRYFTLINSKYPIGSNCIDWGRVKDVQFHSVLPLEKREHNFDERQAALDRSIGVIRGWLTDKSIGQEAPVIVFGDTSRVALHMSVNTLLDCCLIIFLSPQHVYVIPSSAEWCLNYTMKDQLWFGFAAKALTTGWTDQGNPA
jgi:hypothetical protein